MNAFDEAPSPAPAPAEEARHLAAVAAAAGVGVTHIVLPRHEHVVLGGILGIGSASRHPRRLAGLVAVDSGPFAGSQAGIDRLAAFTLDSREFASLDEAVTRALAFNPRRDPRLLRYSLQHNMRRLPDGRWTWKRDQRHLSRQRLAALVEQIRTLAPQAQAIACPTLIVRGADSDLFSAGQATAFAALLRDGTVVTVPDSGHNVQGDNPAR